VLLQARDLTVVLQADGVESRILDAIAFDLEAGEIVDVVGPSGSGKTTLLRALARLLPGATGRLSLDATPAEKIAPSAWRSAVALLPQKPAIVDGTIAENLLLPWTLKAREGHDRPSAVALDAAVARVRLDVALDRDASRLSVGQAARVALVRVVLTAPRVLLLDEPDAALDSASSDAVAEVTREFAEQGGGVVRVRHHRSDGLATRRLHLESGHLVTAEEEAR
jgi:putative ABC transport system ATP-binding protein